MAGIAVATIVRSTEAMKSAVATVPKTSQRELPATSASADSYGAAATTSASGPEVMSRHRPAARRRPTYGMPAPATSSSTTETRPRDGLPASRSRNLPSCSNMPRGATAVHMSMCRRSGPPKTQAVT